MKHLSLISFSIFLLFFTTTSYADVTKKRVQGSKVAKNVSKVAKSIKWLDNFEKVKAEATRRNKMIFWMHIVGDLQGGL